MGPPPQLFSRSLLRLHHIYSSKKLEAVTSFASQASIRSLVKRGRPGFIFAEGPKNDVNEFNGKVKSLRWQSCEMVTILDGLKEGKLRDQIKVVESMKDWNAGLRELGLEEWTRIAVFGDAAVTDCEDESDVGEHAGGHRKQKQKEKK